MIDTRIDADSRPLSLTPSRLASSIQHDIRPERYRRNETEQLEICIFRENCKSALSPSPFPPPLSPLELRSRLREIPVIPQVDRLFVFNANHHARWLPNSCQSDEYAVIKFDMEKEREIERGKYR